MIKHCIGWEYSDKNLIEDYIYKIYDVSACSECEAYSYWSLRQRPLRRGVLSGMPSISSLFTASLLNFGEDLLASGETVLSWMFSKSKYTMPVQFQWKFSRRRV